MILGIGVDIVEIGRMKKAVAKENAVHVQLLLMGKQLILA